MLKKKSGSPIQKANIFASYKICKRTRASDEEQQEKKKNSKDTPLWENAHVVQQYGRLKPNIGFWKRHTFDRTSHKKDNSSVAGD